MGALLVSVPFRVGEGGRGGFCNGFTEGLERSFEFIYLFFKMFVLGGFLSCLCYSFLPLDNFTLIMLAVNFFKIKPT